MITPRCDLFRRLKINLRRFKFVENTEDERKRATVSRSSLVSEQSSWSKSNNVATAIIASDTIMAAYRAALRLPFWVPVIGVAEKKEEKDKS